MSYDPDAKPIEVLKRYQQELWNEGRYDRIADIVASPLRRHYPGKCEELSHQMILDRFNFFSVQFEEMNFYSKLDVCEGAYVTSVWETTARKLEDGARVWTAGIEVFKVTQGLITDVWNGHAQDGQWAWNVLWDEEMNSKERGDYSEFVR